MLQKIKDFIAKAVYSIVPYPKTPAIKRIYSRNSYSQVGEDALVNFLFGDYKMSKITYLDLGTNKPDDGNNTFLFYNKGDRGVCVEADPSLIDKIKEVRPEDKIINAGVSTVNGEADFYIFNEPSISTFDKEEAEHRAALGNYTIDKVVKVPLMNINQIIEQNFDTFPDFMSIDIEGLDLMVLKTLDFKRFPIPVICVETCTYSENHIRPKDFTIKEFMDTLDYEVYADTYVNTIFVNKTWFYKQ